MKLSNNESWVEVVPADKISNFILDGAFVDVFVHDFMYESYCVLTIEQTKELVDYLLGLLGDYKMETNNCGN